MNILYSIPYILLYCIILALTFVESWLKNRSYDRDWLGYTLFFILLCFFGLRGFVLTDWLVYYPFFETIPTLWDGGILNAMKPEFVEKYMTDESIERTGLEMGFVYSSILFKSVIPNYHAWLFANAVVDFLIIRRFFSRYVESAIMPFLFFLIFEGMVLEINLMRNIKAVLLFMISIKYIHEKRLTPFLVLNSIGFFFHSSALLYMPLYFIIDRKWPKSLFWIVLGVGVFILLFQISFLSPVLMWLSGVLGGRISILIQLYLMSDFYSAAYGLFHFGYLERMLTFALLMLYRDKLIEKDSRLNLFINLYLIYFVIYFYFSEMRVVIERLPLLFVFIYWILVPNLYTLIKDRMNQILFVLIFSGYSVVKLVNANSNVLAKYDNVLFGIESYENRHEVYINEGKDLIEGNLK